MTMFQIDHNKISSILEGAHASLMRRCDQVIEEPDLGKLIEQRVELWLEEKRAEFDEDAEENDDDDVECSKLGSFLARVFRGDSPAGRSGER